MSKINAFRIINLSYNNNGIRIDDETFQLNGDSTLLSLRNGGGKSVLVQMMTAPFVHKRFRDVKERPFSSYFTTNKPTFLLVEWVLDGGVGYVLTGMMVRKRQVELEEDTEKDELEVINFITEYLDPNECDIHHLPVLSEGQGGKVLKGYNACINLFDSFKNDRSKKFFVYDMNIPHQSKNYYNKLEEYQIYSKEWESIIKKVNLKESGLSELFMDARDEKGLIDKWFLDAVESKLNKEESRMKEFEKIIQKFIIQFKENKNKIDKKELIKNFKEETLPVLESAKEFAGVIKQKEEIENKIVNLTTLLKELAESLVIEKDVQQVHINTLKEEVDEILYEEYSYDIYKLRDEENEIKSKQQELEENINMLQIDKEKLERKKDILDCAKIYETYKDESREVQILEHKLELITIEEKDLSSERKQLGYSLRHYYENKEIEQIQYIKKLEETLSSNKILMDELKTSIAQKEKEQKEYIAKTGSLSERIKNYTNKEQTYNERFQENLLRNILGEYEPGSLEIKKQEEMNRLKDSKKNLISLKKQREENKEQSYSLSRQLEDNRTLLGTMKAQIKSLENQFLEYEKELTLRKTIIKHIKFDDNQVFLNQEIIEAFNNKINDITEQLRHLHNQEEHLMAEYKKIESGKVFELPKDLEDALLEEGIHITFGMEWLKKNGKSAKENIDIVAANPFLPYGIIMSEQDLNILSKKELGIFTSFPIPIIRREALINQSESYSPLIEVNDKVDFYILFNNNLLDEEGLKKLLEEKHVKINIVKDEINQRDEEKTFYKERMDIIISQNITYEKYHNCKKGLDEAKRQEKEVNEIEHDLRTKIQHLEEQKVKIEEQINTETDLIRILEEKITALQKLNESYEDYLEDRKYVVKLQSMIQTLDTTITSDKDAIVETENVNNDTQIARQKGIIKQKEIHDKVKQYIIYEAQEILSRDIEDMEARFEVITKEISMKEKDIEEQLEKAKSRFEKLEKDLIYITERKNLQLVDYEQAKYDVYVYEEIEKKLKTKEKESSHLNQEAMFLHGKASSIAVQIREKINQLKEKLNKDNIKPRELIILSNFKKAAAEKRHEIQRENEKLELIQNQLMCYEENVIVLSEYSELTLKEMILEKNTILSMDKESLKDFISTLRKDYRNIENERRDCKERLDKLMFHILDIEEFKDEFFKKPFATLSGLTEQPDNFIMQLSTTMEVYDQLLEKLEVDIAFIDIEKEKILEMVLGYVEDVHNSLGKIDKNSTIKVRDRSIKMLKILLPDWNEQVSTYQIRLRDFMDELIKSGMLRLDKNENIEEMIGAQITTKKLYDTVVGIGNIEIKLYKIEEQREYPITWAEVAKNSGGEGFLSAFIVLTSLLSFMRRDDTDIFSQRVQGKVLLMDNPFAQTNAAHLLKPLMDTAKKNNTQLICLSGLGGDSIYNRFDNIYVLTLVASGLKKGMEYLKSDHIKGEDSTWELTSAFVKTEDMEQMELLF